MKIKYNIVGKKNINAETKQVTILLQKDEDEQNNKIYQLNIFPQYCYQMPIEYTDVQELEYIDKLLKVQLDALKSSYTISWDNSEREIEI